MRIQTSDFPKSVSNALLVELRKKYWSTFARNYVWNVWNESFWWTFMRISNLRSTDFAVKYSTCRRIQNSCSYFSYLTISYCLLFASWVCDQQVIQMQLFFGWNQTPAAIQQFRVPIIMSCFAVQVRIESEISKGPEVWLSCSSQEIRYF